MQYTKLKKSKVKSARKSKILPHSKIICLFVIPADIFFLELMTRVFSSGRTQPWYMYLVSFSMALVAGAVFDSLCMISKNRLLNGWICAVLMEVCTFFFTMEIILEKEYSVFYTLKSVFGGAGDLIADAGHMILDAMSAYWYIIAINHLPVVIYLVFFLVFKLRGLRRSRGGVYIVLGGVFLVFSMVAVGISALNTQVREKLTVRYDYDQSIRICGMTWATTLNTVYDIFGNSYASSFTVVEEPTQEENESESQTEAKAETEPAIDYGDNVLEIDFDSISASYGDSVAAICDYIESLTPTQKNEYTGLFEGMNLIEIVAESFVPYFVDEELTPALYRLSTEGIAFTDYYQPLYSGSTTVGEFQVLTGLLPYDDGYSCLQYTEEKNMYMTIANYMKRDGYYTAAFHNGSYTYYYRHLTHPNLGYTDWIGKNNGMTGLLNTESWPDSDLCMMEFAVPSYCTSDQPFCMYFITLSGHAPYTADSIIVERNIDEVTAWAEKNGYEFTDTVLYYYACNLELEKAVEYLFEALETEGILDDTVIALTGDHYPYKLSDEYDESNGAWEGVAAASDDIYANITNLFGFAPETAEDYNHNALYIWSSALAEMAEDEGQVTVSSPTYSVDVLPTLLNLFGYDYDSRLLARRDALAPDSMALVVFSDYSWKTEKGYYDAPTGVFTLSDGAVADSSYDSYITYINTIVQNKKAYSQNVVDYDFYNILFGDN